MSERRPWKFPTLTAGSTINVMADSQQGYRSDFTDNWADRVAEDLQTLKADHVGHAHAGDCVEGLAGRFEDEKYQKFKRDIMQDGKPFLACAGNHDLGCETAPINRSADEWATTVDGRKKHDTFTRMGDLAVIALAPPRWEYDFSIPGFADPQALSDSTLSYLDSALTQLGSTPTWVMTHHLPVGQNGVNAINDPQFVQPWGKIVDVLASHSNAIGWISGHWHISPESTAIGMRALNVGNRKIFGINVPSVTGLNNQSYAVHRYQDNARSMFVTYEGDHVDVRWRNHTEPGWLSPGGKDLHQLTLN